MPTRRAGLDVVLLCDERKRRPLRSRSTPKDVERAQLQARRKGVEYSDYVKLVIHQALLREEQSA